MNVQEIIQNILNITERSRGYYLTGGCYRFALMLQSFIGGDIRWLLQEQHAVLYVEGKLYDVTGNVTSTYLGRPFISESELKQRKKIYLTLV